MDYISNTDQERKEMLAAIGVEAVEELFSMIPEEVSFNRPLNIPEGISELELIRNAQKKAAKNKSMTELCSFMGAGAYEHYVPSIIDHLISRSEFYTAYTPYQAELSQGTLEAIYEYQSMICEITGMGIANASMLDGGSAAAEAVLMAARISRKKKILLPDSIHPAYREVIKTYGVNQELDFKEISLTGSKLDLDELAENLDNQTAAVVVQYPNFYGSIEEMEKIQELMKKSKKALLIVIANPISLGLLKPPAEFGADIVVGEGQSLGNGLNYGGPYLGFMAIKDDRRHLRQLPGRIVGGTSDVDGKKGFVLTLQTREQHIRREKATSNICSNEALNALMATIYLATMGREGLKEVAAQSYHKAHYLADKLEKLDGIEIVNDDFFHEFWLKTEKPITEISDKLLEKGYLAGVDLAQFGEEEGLLLAVTEMRHKDEIDNFVKELEVAING